MSHNECFLIFGGAGLTGRQVARAIAKKLSPRKIVIAGLYQEEVELALKELKEMHPDESIEWEGMWGNIFVREEYTHSSRGELLGTDENRETLYSDLFGNIEDAYSMSRIVQAIREHKPDVIVDSINTATAISYQDASTASQVAKLEIDHLLKAVGDGDIVQAQEQKKDANYAFDMLMLSQSLPQLVRHVQILYRVMVEVRTRLYLKIGTTGTGGMGLNLPYTHSEDRPSVKLMTKTAVAFAHTGLMFLMARSTPGPIVKELKPGAMIGYADVVRRTIKEHGKTVQVYASRTETLGDDLILRENEGDYEEIETLDLPVVDTGENGLFTKGEFEAITALRQMEFITPEEIAREVVLEIRGSNTGHDVIAAVDGGVMNPTYRSGYLRQQVLVDMAHLEEDTNTHSVALGQLGPPELSKLLWETELLNEEFGTLEGVLVHEPEEISRRLYERLQANPEIRRTITSIGVPILSPDGKQLIRGPYLRIPEVAGLNEVELSQDEIDSFAVKGWVDLRPGNFHLWKERFIRMQRSRQLTRGRGSAAITREAYLFDEIRIGEIVGWIFNNEIGGYRIKG